MTAEPDLLPMSSTLLNWPHPTNHVAIRDYARSCVTHAVAPLQAEIEALRAEVATWEGLHASEVQVRQRWQARAERLAEALRELRDLMLRQVKWKSCDCGCPQQRTPDGPHSATWLRAAQQVDIAIGKARGVAE